MDRLTKSTLTQLCCQLSAHPWPDDELNELVAPKLGIITGFQELLDDLERLRCMDLGDLPPAQSIERPKTP